MFRVLDNVPEIYIKESRDFQLISRLYDILFSGVKYDIDSMVNVLDATLVKDSMLLLMCTKIGFFPSVEIDNHILKYIIASFPYIIKNKGSEIGIRYAVNAIVRSESYGYLITPTILIITLPPDDLGKKKSLEQLGKDANKEYIVNIYIGKDLQNRLALDELMRYVLPVGMFYTVNLYKKGIDASDNPTVIEQGDAINIMQVKNKLAGTIRSTYTESEVIDKSDIEDKELVNRLLGAYDTTVVVNSDDLVVEDGEEDFKQIVLEVNLPVIIRLDIGESYYFSVSDNGQNRFITEGESSHINITPYQDEDIGNKYYKISTKTGLTVGTHRTIIVDTTDGKKYIIDTVVPEQDVEA